MKKEHPQMLNNFNNQPDSANQANVAFSKEANNNITANNYSNISNQSLFDINRISEFGPDNAVYSEFYDQNKSRSTAIASNDLSNIPPRNSNNNANSINNNRNFSNNPNNVNQSNSSSSIYESNSANVAAAGYWKMRYSLNNSLFQRIMREDDQLVQEHIHNQKKKESKNELKNI